jgi:excisionase family DNA binding protein
MKKQSTQVYGISPEDLKNEIVAEIKKELQELTKSLQPKPFDELITRQEASQILQISLPTLLSYRKLGIIQAYKFGRKIRYKKEEILDAVKAINYKR